MKKLALFGVAAMMAGLLSPTTARADFTFSTLAGPFNVIAGTGITTNWNDAGNSAGVTADLYGSYTLTTNWSAGANDPWSNEARNTVTTSAGPTGALGATAGAAGNGNPTTLTFGNLGLSGPYDPSVDGTLSTFFNQTFGGSNAFWANVSLTLHTFVPPSPPPTAATINVNGYGDVDSYGETYDGPEIVWLEMVYDGTADWTIDTLGSSFDTELGLYDSNGFLVATDDDGAGGLLSLLSFSGLNAGTYYLAAAGFNAAFGAGFGVTTNSPTAGGTLIINSLTAAVPEPGSLALLGLVAVGMVYRRRR